MKRSRRASCTTVFHSFWSVCTALLTANRTSVQTIMFLDQLPDFLHSLSDGKREIIVMGDFNLTFENERDSEVCKLRSLLKAFV